MCFEIHGVLTICRLSIQHGATACQLQFCSHFTPGLPCPQSDPVTPTMSPTCGSAKGPGRSVHLTSRGIKLSSTWATGRLQTAPRSSIAPVTGTGMISCAGGGGGLRPHIRGGLAGRSGSRAVSDEVSTCWGQGLQGVQRHDGLQAVQRHGCLQAVLRHKSGNLSVHALSELHSGTAASLNT